MTTQADHKRAHKSWRSDVPIILPRWVHHAGGSQSTPTAHPCLACQGGCGLLTEQSPQRTATTTNEPNNTSHETMKSRMVAEPWSNHGYGVTMTVTRARAEYAEPHTPKTVMPKEVLEIRPSRRPWNSHVSSTLRVSSTVVRCCARSCPHGPVSQEKNVEVQQAHYIDRIADVSVMVQRQVPTIQTAHNQRQVPVITEVPQEQYGARSLGYPCATD